MPLATYRITDLRAIIYDRPAGRRLRGMALDELFQGRPAPSYPGWIMRTEDGETPRGYIMAALCTPLDLAALAWTAEDPPARVRPDLLGDATDALSRVLARGRTGARVLAVKAAFSDYAAELVNRAASQAAGVSAHLLERQAADRITIAQLEQRIAALEALRAREVGE